MKKSRISYTSSIILAVFLSVILAACSGEDNPYGGNQDPDPIDTSTFTYPMSNGMAWVYNRTFSVENIRPDSIRYLFTYFPVYGGGGISILYDTNIGTANTKCFYEEYIEYGVNDTDTWHKRTYMKNDSNGLMCYAYRIAYGGSGIPYGPANSIGFVKFNRHYGSLFELSASVDMNSSPGAGDDSLIIEDPPVMSLKYPVIAGEQWFFKSIPEFTDIYKKNISFVKLNVLEDRISCIKNERIMAAFAYELELYDYYSRFGQLKRDYLFKNILVTTINHPDGVGYIDMRDDYTVTGIIVTE